MRILIVAILLAAGLAGCADNGTQDTETESFSEELDASLQATATTGIIRGVVIDETITPVPNAVVTITGTEHTATSNEMGAFGFDGLEPATYFLSVSRPGYNGTQTSVAVEAGVDQPPVVKMLMTRAPKSGPYVVPTTHNGFLACGAAVFTTSVGCTTYDIIAENTQSTSIWGHEFESDKVLWTQGELIWDHNQPAGGELIWEITERTNTHIGYRETAGSPALAYVNTTVLQANGNDILQEGVHFRFFGGPHPSCKLPEPVERPPEAPRWYSFGCGVTLDQGVEVFIHDFYNFAPDEGWRYLVDGDHPLPT